MIHSSLFCHCRRIIRQRCKDQRVSRARSSAPYDTFLTLLLAPYRPNFYILRQFVFVHTPPCGLHHAHTPPCLIRREPLITAQTRPRTPSALPHSLKPPVIRSRAVATPHRARQNSATVPATAAAVRDVPPAAVRMHGHAGRAGRAGTPRMSSSGSTPPFSRRARGTER